MAFKDTIICEKHAQAKIFKKALNLNQTKKINGVNAAYYNSSTGICCVYQSGHVFELLPPEAHEPLLARDKKGWDISLLPVLPPNDKWPLEIKKDSRPKEQKRLNALVAGLKWALVDQGTPGTIYLAVDNDREGDLLGWEALEYFNLVDHPNIKRCLYSRIGEKSMLEAYKNAVDAKPKYYQIYLSGQGRRNADWGAGMNMTIALTSVNRDVLPPYNVLNSGRVVWAISYLLYCRQKSIDSFVPRDYYNESVEFDTEGSGPLKTTVSIPEEWLDPESKKFIDKAKAEKLHAYVQKVGKGRVAACEKEKKEQAPPVGFDRNDFDRHMIRRHKMNMKQIADAMQHLYGELDLITYPRVDYKYLDENMHADMPMYIKAMLSNLLSSSQIDEKTKARYKKASEFIDASRRSKIWKKGVDEKESHHAIIPTDVKYDKMSDLTPHQTLVYKELAERLLCQFLPNYEFYKTSVIMEVGQFQCKASGSAPFKAGWKGLTVDTEEEKDESDQGGNVPVVEVGKVLKISKCEMKTSTTVCPTDYTVDELLGHMKNPRPFVKNKELVKRLKNLEIGTSATREPHITSLVPKRLVELKKVKGKETMIPTKRLMSLMEVAPDYLKLPETSAYWEDFLQRIEKGESTLDVFLERQEQLLDRFMKDLHAGKFKLKSPVDACYPCGDGCSGHLFLKEPKGKKFKLWSCNTCDKAYFDNDGNKGALMGAPSSGGASDDNWVPPAGTRNQKCPSCADGKVYLKDIPGKKFKLWCCLSCKKKYFDSKGKIGNEFGTKK